MGVLDQTCLLFRANDAEQIATGGLYLADHSFGGRNGRRLKRRRTRAAGNRYAILESESAPGLTFGTMSATLRSFLLALLAQAILLGCSTTSVVTGSQPQLCGLSVGEEGVELTIRVVYSMGFETTEISSESNCVVPSVWVEFGDDWESRSDRLALRQFRNSRAYEVFVDFTGVKNCAGGYGHLGLYPCRFTVTSIQKFHGTVGARYD